MHMPSSLRTPLRFAALLVPLIGCSGDASGPADDGRTATLQVVAGAGQRAVVTARLPEALTVVALDAQGAPVTGTTVRFAVSSGGGTVEPTSATTDAQGRASTSWTLGTAAGTHRVTATAGSASAEVSGVADAGAPVSFALAQDSFALEPGMDSVLHYTARDAHGNANTAVRPTFAVDDPRVASVSAAGGVLAAAAGRTTVRAQLGSMTDQATLTVGFRFVDVVTGYDHACARTAGNRAHCWGLTRDYQAGAPRGETCDAGAACLRAPAIVTDDVAFSALGLGLSHSCGVGNAGRLFCWGSNASWALGAGNTDWGYRADRPVAVEPARSWSAVAADDGFACALTAGGAAHCWGRPGALGSSPAPTQPVPTPQPVAGTTVFASIATSPNNACGLTAQGEAWCWGANGSGQLGVGDRNARDTPVRVNAGVTFRSLSLGGAHACAIGSDDRVWCWGSNSHGQLGVDVIAEALTPVAITSPLRFTAVAAGGTHACALATDGAAHCWGSNYDGQLGNGFVGSGWQPRPVAGGLRFTRLHAKRDFTCAIGTDERAYCWGDNDHGQVGDGGTTDRVAPVRVQGQM